MSLFNGDERANAEVRLRSYARAHLHEGPAEGLIDSLIERFSMNEVAILMDGPKARAPAWDVLVATIFENFHDPNFLCFDSVQDHVPFRAPNGEFHHPKRSMNLKRLKMVNLYQAVFRERLSVDYSKQCILS